MKLGEQFKKEVATVPPDASIRKVTFLMRDCGVGAVVVVNGKGKLVGIVTMDDLLARELGNLAEGAIQPVLAAAE